jgi:hypothetical protein
MTDNEVLAFHKMAQIMALAYRCLREEKLPRLLCYVLTAIIYWRVSVLPQPKGNFAEELMSQIRFRETA